MGEWLTTVLPDITVPPEVQKWLASNGVRIVSVIVLAIAIRWIAKRSITQVVKGLSTPISALAKADSEHHHAGAQEAIQKRRLARIATLGSLLRSITTVVVFSVAFLTVLGILNIPLTPLLASAGIGGVIIGIGAQNVVKDFLNGLFMLLEDQYGVGDEIDTGEAVGTVRGVGLRVTRLIDDDGVTWYVRNGEITRIGNRSRSWSQAVVDMPVSYQEDPQHVIEIIDQALDGITDKPPFSTDLREQPRVVGVQSVAGQTMTIRVKARTVAGKDNSVARGLRQRIKRALDEAGVKGPPIVPGAPE